MELTLRKLLRGGPLKFAGHQVCHVLRAHRVRATFFLVGKEVTGWPALVDVPRETARRNAIGDHTYDHVSVAGASPETLDREIGDAQGTIRSSAGVPVRLFRPPFGLHDAASDAAVRARGMLEVLWNVDSGDSRGATAAQILDAVRTHAAHGSIILLHENRGTTQAALPRILDVLRNRGLRPVTVPELLANDPPRPEQLRTASCA
jgi:peptidoglycan/xylan/chitin deacetylase (PgdA/CDA1 family)